MYCAFEPPYDEYGDMMFERRLAMEGSASPVTSRASRAGESRRGSTVADTDGKSEQASIISRSGLTWLSTEPRSSPVPSRGRNTNRSARTSTRGTRSTRLQVEIGTGSQGKVSDEGGEGGDGGEGDSEEEDTGGNEDDEEEGDEVSDANSDEEEDDGEKGGSRSTRAQTSRSKAKEDKKPSGGAATRRTGRRR